jgi:hypothetical protein
VCLSKISKSLSGYGLSFLIIFHALYVFLVLAHVAFYRLQSKVVCVHSAAHLWSQNSVDPKSSM